MEDLQNWLFTFGYNHAHPNKFIKIWGTRETSRVEMNRRFGPKWAFQYPESKQKDLEDHNIQEIK